MSPYQYLHQFMSPDTNTRSLYKEGYILSHSPPLLQVDILLQAPAPANPPLHRTANLSTQWRGATAQIDDGAQVVFCDLGVLCERNHDRRDAADVGYLELFHAGEEGVEVEFRQDPGGYFTHRGYCGVIRLPVL